MGSNVILLLGSNLGDRFQLLQQAKEKINTVIGKVILESKVYETASWGNKTQDSYLNQVIEAETSLLPVEVLAKILQIEESLGRTRVQKWESRIIDIDILFIEDQIIESPELVVPHPFLHERRFTLVPLVEIHPTQIHPVFHKTCQQLLEELTDLLPVAEYNPPLVINKLTFLK